MIQQVTQESLAEQIELIVKIGNVGNYHDMKLATMYVNFKKMESVFKKALSLKDKDMAKSFLLMFAWEIKKIYSESKVKNLTWDEAENIAKEKLAYYAEHRNIADRIFIEDMYECEHPVFGKAAHNQITPEVAFKIGLEAGVKARKSYEKEH